MQQYINPWDDPDQNPYIAGSSYVPAQGLQPTAAPAPGLLSPVGGHTGPVSPVTTPATTTPATPTTPTTGTGTQPYSDAALQAILRKYPATPDGRNQALQEANTTFGTHLSWSGSKGDKLTLPDGRTIDAVIGSGTSNPTWGWQDASASGNAGGPVDLNSIAINPSYLAPWTGTAPQPGVPTFQSPGDFHAPSSADVLADPSYQFRLSQGEGAVQNSAAAKGLLNSGGTLTDILNYGQNAASQEYGNVWDRNFGVWNSGWTNALAKYRADESSSNDAYQRAWNAYTDARDSFYNNQSNAFGKLYQVASLGANSAAAS